MPSRLRTQIILLAVALTLSAVFVGAFVGGGTAALSRLLTWGMFLTTALIAGVISYFLSDRISRSVNQVTESVQALAQCNFRPRPRISNADEFVSAASAIQTAADDISFHRRNADEEITRLSTILESMADGVIAVDDRYEVLLANAACQRMLRLPSAELAGRPLLEVTRSRALYDAVGQALSRPGSLTTELTVGDNPRSHFMLRTAQLPGEPCPGVVVVLHDVTEVRRLENIRKEFVANVSHELKTPLASIKAYAETLRMGAINDPEHNVSFVCRIEEDANRLNGLIGDMLQIARIESHQQAFKIRPINFDKQVDRCRHDMAGRAEAKNIQLQFFPPPQPVMVLADDEGAQTILANLVDNAIKYTPRDGTVSLRWNIAGDHMLFLIEDTGMGIETEHQSRIFERFFRVDRARNRDSGGTGLGLSIVKHLVQAFDGSISVSSRLGQGSRFEVRLKLADGGES